MDFFYFANERLGSASKRNEITRAQKKEKEKQARVSLDFSPWACTAFAIVRVTDVSLNRQT